VVTARQLKIVWREGFNDRHHYFDITSPVVIDDVVVAHVTKESVKLFVMFLMG
jgi:hypothetical protein